MVLKIEFDELIFTNKWGNTLKHYKKKQIKGERPLSYNMPCNRGRFEMYCAKKKRRCTTVAVRKQDNSPNEIWKEMTKKALSRVTRPGKNINLRDGHEYVREVFVMQKRTPFNDGCRRV
jgi:hypothetical protein